MPRNLIVPFSLWVLLFPMFGHTSSALLCPSRNGIHRHSTILSSSSESEPDHHSPTIDRRKLFTTLNIALLSAHHPAQASAKSSPTTEHNYPIQKSASEWSSTLSPQQYYILREGGTERPNSSILESEDRPGVFKCAGCDTPLFESSAKFHSGTGWPSFASALPGVEVKEGNLFQETFAGRELKCATCGGHLGDVFNDGMLFVNTPAFKTGKRYCIDGWALVFYQEGGGGDVVRGDRLPEKKSSALEKLLEPPKITPRD